MAKHQSHLFFSTMLFFYLIGRMLQPFAGRVPNLLLVIFHVIPPALFALVHGARLYRWRGILVFTGLSLGVGTISESLSLRTGFPFGHYRFTDLMGPKVLELPVLLALAYVGMGYLSWVVSVAILGGADRPLSGTRICVLPLLACGVMTAWDLSMEAVWADIDRAWVWRDGGPYFGVPIGNFLGWLLTTFGFYQLFAIYLRGCRPSPSSRNHQLLAVGFYALSALGDLLVTAPSSADGIFVDETGKRWVLANVLAASRLVSSFVMLPFGVLAWWRLSKTLKTDGRP